MTREELLGLIKEAVDPRLKSLEERAQASKKAEDYLARLESQEKTVKAEKGIAIGMFCRALAAGKGDQRRAADFAENTLHAPEGIVKALGTTPGDAGGFLVPEEYSQELIELLRPRSVVRSLNPMIVPMSTGTMAIPRLAAGGTATYQSESTATRASQEKLEQLRLTWKKLTAIVPISNELLRYSSPSADSIVRDDLTQIMAIAEDVAFIRGSGTQNAPKGLHYWTEAGNTEASNYTGSESDNNGKVTDLDKDALFLIGQLLTNNVRMIRPAFLMTPRSALFLSMQRTNLGDLAYPTMEGDAPKWKGYRVGVTNNIPSNLGSGSDAEVYFADFADVVIGEATQFILEVSNEAAYVDSTGTLQSSFARDETIIKAVARHDFAMRHPVSVAYLSAVKF